MERIRANYFAVLVAAIAGVGGFLFGFDSSVVANIKDQVMSQFSLTTWQWSWVVSTSVLGCIIGIPVSGLFADRLSQKWMLQMIAIGFIFGTLCCVVADNINILLAGRFIIGVCIGIASYISPLYIAEISPARHRGAFILTNGLAITFGQAFSYLIGYFLHDIGAGSWRTLLLIGIFPALVLLVGMMLAPHSPRWLLKTSGEFAALNALEKMRASASQARQELAEMIAMRTPARFQLATSIFPILLVGVVLGIFQQFSGINPIMHYGSVIFESAGVTPARNAMLATSAMGVINFIFTIVTFMSVDHIGRRLLLLIGSLIATISMILIGSYFNQHDHESIRMLLLMSVYVIGYCVSVGSLFSVIISEIFPLAVRGFAMSIATAIQWSANLTVSISFLTVYEQLGQARTFWLFGGICFLLFLFTYYFVPEATGVTLESIEYNLAAGKRLRDIGRPLSESIIEEMKHEAAFESTHS